ncbi:MAG: hypothetical protein R3B54_16660 [Bdellovibrionota bacterium]
MWFRAIVFFCFTILFANTTYADTETVQANIDTCLMVFRVEGSGVEPLHFKPERMEIGFSMRMTQSGRPDEPLIYEDRVNTTGHPFEPSITLYRDGRIVLARWWTGLPDEYVQFPMQFVTGDWQTLAAGGAVELLAPEDVTNLVEAQLSDWAAAGTNPVRYFNLEVEDQDAEGTTIRIRREEPFRPRFFLKDGFLQAEGILSNFVMTLEIP